VITPRILRRSLRRALRWRVLLLWWAALAVPGAIAVAPAFAFLRTQLDRSTAARNAVAWMDGPTLLELVRQVHESGAEQGILLALGAAVAMQLLCAPFVAAAMVASARGDESLPFSRLLGSAGELYGRMLRTAVAGLIPLGAGAAIAAGAFKLAANASDRALTETHAGRGFIAAGCAAVLVIFIGALLVDAARSQFAADPGRRSAIAALWSGSKMVWRLPLRAAGIGAVGTVLGVGGALTLMTIRLQIPQQRAVSMLLAWLLAQGAQLAVGFGRAIRIEGLAELSRAAAEASRRASSALPPGGTSQGTEVVHSTTLSALEPARSGAPR
jgi:hypothetical protein